MINFEDKYFRKFEFTEEQVKRFFDNALRDYEIAKENNRSEVKFNYCYSAFVKAGIALIASVGKVKVRSIPGHHVRVIEKMAEIIDDDAVLALGNAMRTKRNEDFYGGGIFVSEKEAEEYLEFIGKMIKQVKRKIGI